MRYRVTDFEGVATRTLESGSLSMEVVPDIGGRIVRLVEKSSGHQFLWRNPALRLQPAAPGSAYDPLFFGGIDEVIPGDLEEVVDGISCPDHGELWTLALEASLLEDTFVLRGRLPRCGLTYERRIRLHDELPMVEWLYRIENPNPQPRAFLWKLHAALEIQPGDRIVCPARRARVADPAWSRFSATEPFAWPCIEGRRADIIPAPGAGADFYFLYELERGELGWWRPEADLAFLYSFPLEVFPYACVFASYGALLGHYTAVLEPATSMPLSVNAAKALGQCAVLAPGAAVEARVCLRAGRASAFPGLPYAGEDA